MKIATYDINGVNGRLPVLRDGDGLVGLLTERDVVIAQAQAERSGRTIAALTVADALPEDAADRIVLVSPDSARDQIVELLRRPGVVACLVTPDGSGGVYTIVVCSLGRVVDTATDAADEG